MTHLSFDTTAYLVFLSFLGDRKKKQKKKEEEGAIEDKLNYVCYESICCCKSIHLFNLILIFYIMGFLDRWMDQCMSNLF